MCEKKLTVIVPSYNMEKYLPGCLSSLIVEDRLLLEQLDVIVVNDGSTDTTSEVAHKFEEKYPGIVRVIDKCNGHYGSCINAALEVAKGTFIRTLDADDSYDTSAFEHFLRQLVTLEQVDCVVTDFCTVDPSGKLLETIQFSFQENRVMTLNELVEFDDRCVCHFSVCYRTQILRDMGYRQIEGSPYTDMQWSFLPATNVKSIRYIPQCVYRYLVGRDGQTMQPKEVCRQIDKQASVALKIYREYISRKDTLTPNSDVFWHKSLIKNVLWISRIYAIGYGDAVPVSTGRDFDQAVKELLPTIYCEIESARTGRILPFAYIRAWRRDYSRCSFSYKLFQLRNMIVKSCRYILKI